MLRADHRRRAGGRDCRRAHARALQRVRGGRRQISLQLLRTRGPGRVRREDHARVVEVGDLAGHGNHRDRARRRGGRRRLRVVHRALHGEQAGVRTPRTLVFQEDRRGLAFHRRADRHGRALAPGGAEGRAQRPVPLRQREEVQEVLREGHMKPAAFLFDLDGTLLDICYLLDNMYVKKATREYFKQNKRAPKGPYTSWLMRIIQYINTQEGEFFLPTIIPDLTIDTVAHDSLHSGVATAAEQLPDFTMTDNRTAELKICSVSYLDVFKNQLRDKFEDIKRDDFHNADGGLFITKEPIPRLFSVDLSSYEAAQVIRERPEFNLSELHLILTDDRGHIDFKDWPALPCAFLFGFVASWLKE